MHHASLDPDRRPDRLPALLCDPFCRRLLAALLMIAGCCLLMALGLPLQAQACEVALGARPAAAALAPSNAQATASSRTGLRRTESFGRQLPGIANQQHDGKPVA